MKDLYAKDVARLRHAPKWFGQVSRIDSDSAVISAAKGSEIPDVGGWPLPIELLENINPAQSIAP